jgi:hypothetical protein
MRPDVTLGGGGLPDFQVTLLWLISIELLRGSVSAVTRLSSQDMTELFKEYRSPLKA